MIIIINIFFFSLGITSIQGLSENCNTRSKFAKKDNRINIDSSLMLTQLTDSYCATRRKGSWTLFSHSSNGYEKSLRNMIFPELVPKSVASLILTTTAVLLSKKERAFSDTNNLYNEINLNSTEPTVTDVCWLDIRVGDGDIKRIEIALYGEVVPKTVKNFKLLCNNSAIGSDVSNPFGYRGSEIFRIIAKFSVQGGNIGSNAAASPSMKGRFGRAAIPYDENDPTATADGFPLENFRILHSYREAGVVSMMREPRTVTLHKDDGSDSTEKQALQDSRFFVTLSPYASWADSKYVAFGRVTKGLEVLRDLQALEVQAPANYPLTPVRIVDSGCY